MEMQLGRKAPLESMQRFLRTMDELGETQLAAIETVDTRYPNGYAITWKSGTNIDWKAVTAKTKPDLNAY
jgi:cell division protein FtsQ